jgi:hypothetical protein
MVIYQIERKEKAPNKSRIVHSRQKTATAFLQTFYTIIKKLNADKQTTKK